MPNHLDPDVVAAGTEPHGRRTAKLERLRLEIASGTYLIDLDALARALVTKNACSRQR